MGPGAGESPVNEANGTAGGPVSINALILIAVCAGLGLALARMPDPPGVLTFLFVASSWLLSVVVHEFGHALAAYRAGDTTVAAKGYLTLDPLRYTDLTTTLVLPLLALALGGIGFPGGAVYLREDLMRTRAGRSLASLAGPLGTLAVLLFLGLLLSVGPAGLGAPLHRALAFLAFLQATALILNLLPVPGLDGFGVLRPFLPAAIAKGARRVEPLAFMVLFALILFVPLASDLFFAAALSLTQVLGVPGAAIGEGWDSFRFWIAPGR